MIIAIDGPSGSGKSTLGRLVARAERRYSEDQLKGSTTTLAETLADMKERDRRDSSRLDSPLKIADDAVVIDSTGKGIDEVLAEMLDRVNRGSDG